MPTKITPPCDIALVQLEGVHEEVASGFVRAFAELGLDSVLHFNSRIQAQRGDFFKVITHTRAHLDYMKLEGRPDWTGLQQALRDEAPRLLFLNTLQRDAAANLALEFDLPVFGVIHNHNLFQDSAACMQLVRRGRLEVFGLAPHVVEVIERDIPALKGHVHLHLPYDWKRPGVCDYALPGPGERLEIVIPGAVDFKNRAFELLVGHLAQTDLSGLRRFRLVVVAGGADRAALETLVAESGLDDLFDFEPLDPVSGRVPHDRLMARYSASHAFLPLLPPGRFDYVRKKITTGVVAAIGAERPQLAPPGVARAYGFEPLKMPPGRPFDLSQADLSDENLLRLHEKTARIAAEGLAQNRQVISDLLGRYI